MDDKSGFIKLNRKMLEWEWYKDINTKTVFIHCLFKANWKDGRFQGYEIPRGSFVTSYQQLSDELSSKKEKMSVHQVRTALKHLILTKEVAIKTTSKFSIISINNYDKYQRNDKVDDNQVANE